MSGLQMSWRVGEAMAYVDPKRRGNGRRHWMPWAVIGVSDGGTAKLSRTEGEQYLTYEEARDLAQSWALTLNKIYGGA